jgi:type IV pilus assembly protein PilB
MLASAVTMVLSSGLSGSCARSVRTLETHHDREELEKMGFSKEEIPSLQLYGPSGCPECNGGYKGRVGLYELMEVTDEVSKAINATSGRPAEKDSLPGGYENTQGGRSSEDKGRDDLCNRGS